MTDEEAQGRPMFFRLEGTSDAHGDEIIVSREAWMIHGFAVITSVRDGHAGFIGDDYLNAITAESVTAAELCLSGLWERVDDGYLIHDERTINYAADMTRRLDEGKAICAERGRHDTVADNPAICLTCLAPLGDDHR